MKGNFDGVYISFVLSCLLNTVFGSCMSGNDTLCLERGAGCCCDGWRIFGDYCLPSDYREPTIKNCPNKDHKVLVDATNNVAYLHNPGITATDWVGQPLHVSLSQYEFHHCQCSNSIEVVTATAVDKFRQAATCRFTVSVEDNYKPGFANCPDDQIVSSVERVIWKEPTVTDNVGVWKLSRPRYNNTTRFRPGIYNLSYSASDWSGNVAECSFKITILEYHTSDNSSDSPNSISDTVIGAIFIVVVLISLAIIHMCRKRNQQRSMLREHIQNISGVISVSTLHDNPVFMIHNNDLPPYEIVGTVQLPEYSPRINPPSYDGLDV